MTDLNHVLTTTRSVRLRLDYDRPVPIEVVGECLQLALQAPTGGAAEDWRWLVVGDRALKDELCPDARARGRVPRPVGVAVAVRGEGTVTEALIRDIDEVLTTTRAVRNRMDFDRPVDRAVVETCLRLAQQAPMGSNLQDWRIVAVDDPGLKKKLSDLYTEVWYQTVEGPLASGEAATTTRLSPSVRPDPVAQDRQARILTAVKYLVDNLERVPVLVVLCSTKPVPAQPVGGTASGYYGSIFPFAWSFQLALRSRGLGSVMATALAHKASKVRAVLGLPDDWRPVTLLPVAYTKGLDFRPAARADLSDVAFWNGPSERAAPS